MSANSNSSRPSNACVLGRTNSRKKSMAIRQVTPNHQISIGHVTTMRLKPATLSGAGLPKQSHINTDRLLRESAMRGELMQQTPANHYTAFVKKIIPHASLPTSSVCRINESLCSRSIISRRSAIAHARLKGSPTPGGARLTKNRSPAPIDRSWPATLSNRRWVPR